MRTGESVVSSCTTINDDHFLPPCFRRGQNVCFVDVNSYCRKGFSVM